MNIQQLIVGMMDVCCYIISCPKTGKAAVIDCGGDVDKVLAACQKEGLEVIYLIATHGHPDHVCGNGPLKQATGAQIVMHRADADFFSTEEASSYFSMLGLPESPPADVLVEDGDLIRIGEETLTVIHTPGHTPGSICLYSNPNCFSGDTLFAGGVGRTDFPGGSMRELSQSISERLLPLPPETTVWPGHGYGGSKSTIGKEARSNPYL